MDHNELRLLGHKRETSEKPVKPTHRRISANGYDWLPPVPLPGRTPLSLIQFLITDWDTPSLTATCGTEFPFAISFNAEALVSSLILLPICPLAMIDLLGKTKLCPFCSQISN